MRITATVTSKGQVTIPQQIRRRLGLKQGDRIEFIIENGGAVIRPARAGDNPFAAYTGVLGGFATEAEINAWMRALRDD